MTSFQKGNTGPLLEYPLTEIPPDDGTSRLVSPRVGECHGLPEPIGPGEPGFAEELLEVVLVVADVNKGVWPVWYFEKYGMPVPVTEAEEGYWDPTEWVTDDQPSLAWQFFYDEGTVVPRQAADMVHMDDPTDLGQMLSKWLVANGHATWKADSEPHKNFVEQQGFMADLAANVHAYLEKAFDAKYMYGRIRPEEAAGMNFTRYPEGCPCHPSAPAGHSAAAKATYVTIIEHLNMSDDIQEQVWQICRIWAHARTLAGVHYASDNEMGLAL